MIYSLLEFSRSAKVFSILLMTSWLRLAIFMFSGMALALWSTVLLDIGFE